jgi:hypothetical protein
MKVGEGRMVKEGRQRGRKEKIKKAERKECREEGR